jgi:hypothetical protein
VDVWVDSRNLVRREKLSLTLPAGSGAPAGASLVMTTDFYDFGVPVPNKPAAVARTVLPAQRSFVQPELGSAPAIGAPTITVSSLHVKSAQLAGNSSWKSTFLAHAGLGAAEEGFGEGGAGG